MLLRYSSCCIVPDVVYSHLNYCCIVLQSLTITVIVIIHKLYMHGCGVIRSSIITVCRYPVVSDNV
jgi:hypothetical protein